jgi:GT2 family glycosyltransferase
MKPICLIVPVYGEAELTHQMIADVVREGSLVDVVVIDNKGDFASPFAAVHRPDQNLGWLGGTNFGLFTYRLHAYPLYVCMNNDVRLSEGFFAALLPLLDREECGLYSPAYRGSFWHQHPSDGFQGGAHDYKPAEIVRPVPNIDGTCMCIPHRTLDMVGYLDPFFEPSGWGADHDYCIRVKQIHKTIYVTEAAYLYHYTHVTACGMDSVYPARGFDSYKDRMSRKYGAGYLNEVWRV